MLSEWVYEGEDTAKQPNLVRFLFEAEDTNWTSSAVLPVDIESGKIYLAHHREDGKWGPIGGSRAEGDQSAVETALREFLEETGITLKPWNLGSPGRMLVKRSGNISIGFIYPLTVCKLTFMKLQNPSAEIDELRDFTIEEIRELLVNDEIRHLEYNKQFWLFLAKVVEISDEEWFAHGEKPTRYHFIRNIISMIITNNEMY